MNSAFLIEDTTTEPEDFIVDDALANQEVDLTTDDSDDESLNFSNEELDHLDDDDSDLPEDSNDVIEVDSELGDDEELDDTTEVYADDALEDDDDDDDLLDAEDMEFDDVDDEDFMESEARRANADIVREAYTMIEE